MCVPFLAVLPFTVCLFRLGVIGVGVIKRFLSLCWVRGVNYVHNLAGVDVAQ